jgi:ABC-type dipeptide/oligopeptide/nickel transport system permease component
VKAYIAPRLAVAVLTLFDMSVVIFVLLRLAPGDIVDVLRDTLDPRLRGT